jgi:hypothetical protein
MKSLLKLGSSYYLGGCTVLAVYYATWFHYYGTHVHLDSILNIVCWPWDLLVMLASWML